MKRRSPASALILLLGPVVALGLGAGPCLGILERSGEHVQDAGVFRLTMTNLGILGNPWYPSFSDLPSLEWPAGSGHEYLLEAGLWVGARDRSGNQISVSTAAPVNELRPGLEASARIVRSFSGAAGSLRFGTTPTAAEADDDGDGEVDEEFLNGLDDDDDGRADEDYLGFGSQVFGCEYSDFTPEARSQLLAHVPLEVAVRQLSFTWTEGIEALDHCAVVRYEVENRGGNPLYDVYLGFYVDPDVGPKAAAGYWRDDRFAVETVAGTFPTRGAPVISGCESTLFERTVVVVEDVPDGAGGASGGDVPGLVGAFILSHTTDRWGFRAPEEIGASAVIHLSGRPSPDRNREEIADGEKYALMAGGEVTGDLRTDDHRFVLVAGPFSELTPGRSIEFTVALVLAADRAELAGTVSRLVEEFHGRWLDLDGMPFTGFAGLETCLTDQDARFCNFSVFRVDHDCDERQTQTFKHAGCRNSVDGCICSPGASCTCRLRILGPECVYVDFDCDPCTPSVSGGEALVHWATNAARVSSRPVEMQVTAGDGEVQIAWDNAAELPTARRELPPVKGYRVWRADGWTRPPGAGGPETERFEVIAELPLPESGLPPAPVSFVVEDVEVLEWVPGPGDSLVPHYAVGRYRFVDREVQNGFALFYDVTPFAIAVEDGVSMIESLTPRGRRGEEVFPVMAPSETGPIRVVPNPYVGRAGWDLEPSRADPSGRKILFTGLPGRAARIAIHTLAGDLVRTLEHDGHTGSADWDLLSRNGQPVAPGIYLYVIEAQGLRHQGKLVIVQ